VTSDAASPACREPDEVLGPSASTGDVIADGRTGKDGLGGFVGTLRQSDHGRGRRPGSPLRRHSGPHRPPATMVISGTIGGTFGHGMADRPDVTKMQQPRAFFAPSASRIPAPRVRRFRRCPTVDICIAIRDVRVPINAKARL
jgi:hypothetical protein